MFQVLSKRFECWAKQCLIVNAWVLLAVPLLGSFVVSDSVKHASERFRERNLKSLEQKRRSDLLHLGNVDHFIKLVLDPFGVILDAFAHFLTHTKTKVQITTFGCWSIFLLCWFVPSFDWSVFSDLFPPHRPVPSSIVCACRSILLCVLQSVKRNLQRVFLR